MNNNHSQLTNNNNNRCTDYNKTDMKNGLLTILGSSCDYFYEADSYPEEGDFSHAQFKGMMAGGCPLNVGVVCASKGVQVKAMDMLGTDDDTTSFLLSELKHFNIDTSDIEIHKDVTNGKVIIILSGDKRTMFVVDPKRPPYVMNEKKQELLNNATYIYSLMHILNRSFSDMEPLLEAKRNGARIILDGSSKYDDPSRMKILYSLCDGLFINETDYERLKVHSPDDPKKLIFEKGGEFVIVTHGSEGSTLYLKDREIQRSSLNNIEVKDSTGAGDAFAGAFLGSLLAGYEYEKALYYATLNGAYACSVFGASSTGASFEKLDQFAKEHHYDL